MTVRPIVKFPHSLLRAKAEPVRRFDADLHALAGDLLDTMRAAGGVGITAPHIGILQRIVVIELAPDDGTKFYVNPEIHWASAEKIRHQEGSVSMPGLKEEIERPAQVRVNFQDLDGAPHTLEADGFLSICLQHEIDQLDGIFWIDRLSRLKRDRLIKRFEKLSKP